MNDTSLQSWLASLGSRNPTPGGGAAAAVLAAIASSLLQMVANFTTGKRWIAVEPRMRELVAELGNLNSAALQLASEDERGFLAVARAYGLPRATVEEAELRSRQIQSALVLAAQPPTEVGVVVMRLLEIAGELVELGNPNVMSDVGVASSAARAALESAILNVAINQRGIRDDVVNRRLASSVDDMSRAIAVADSLTSRVKEKVSG